MLQLASFYRRTQLFPIIFVIIFITIFTDFGVIADSGSNFGAGLVWNYDQSSKTLTVSCLSAHNNMPDYNSPEYASSDLPPWQGIKNDIESVVIENGVLNIGSYAFSGCPALKTVHLSDTVGSIEKGAFSGCSLLKNITFPDNLQIIGDYAFTDCVSLFDLSFPDNLSYIGTGAFNNCKSIKALYIPENLTFIKPLAFAGCSGIESIKADRNNAVFVSCGNCLIDKTETAITFGCKNSIIPVDGSVTMISPYAFYNCTGLKSINIPNIGNNTFSIGENAFFGCDNLSDIRFYGDKTDWDNMLKFNTGNNNQPLVNATCRFFGFKDVMNNSWYASAVQYVSCNNVILGYNDGNFGATDYLKRQDAVVILSRLSKSDLSVYGNISPFLDVPKNQYYTSAIVWGKTNGIVNGYMTGKFGVGDKVTREQFICFLYRYAKHAGIDTTTKIDRSYFAEKYIDFYSVSPYAVDAVCWALEKGIISGRTATTIAPGGYALRCEISQIFFNLYKTGTLF